MRNSDGGDRRQNQQQQGSSVPAKPDFKPVRLPAVAAAVQANKPATHAAPARQMPAFLRDDASTD